MMKILLVDDDQELCELLVRYLQREGIEVDQVHTGADGLRQAFTYPYDAMVLDVMMPGMTGLEVLTELRKKSQLPVVMLTAKGDEMDRIVGLEIGADDYLPKPCNPRELIARLRAVFRRAQSEPTTKNSDVIRIDELEIDHSQHHVLKNNELLELTVTEYNILNTLVSHLGTVVEKNQLAEEAMSRSLTLFDRSLDMHLSNLRKKLGVHDDGQARIKTIRGVGYMYVTAQA
ncbi:MAG TPA: DNA-binding response regulator [Oceanospirillales bacterium]|nr:DNA-binding response regulator [Oleispira sp.]HCM04934.1 DNA-binding response regulator [Oceanospirillales bacterium]